MATRVLTAHIPVELTEKVDELAGRLERSRGWMVEQALAEWIDAEDQRHRLTLEALADVEGSRVVSHDAVAKWAESLGTRAPRKAPRR